MNKIVSIKPIKQEGAVVTLETNQGTIPHITTMHLVIKYHLEVGMTLSKSDYQLFIKDNEYEILFQKAISYISYQMRTISEVKQKLRSMTKEESVINRIIEELKSHQYLGDLNYVKEYVNEKLSYDLVGPKYIKDKLIQKGVHYDLIDAELIRFTDTLQYSKVEDLLHKELQYPPKKPYYKFVDSFKRKCVNKGFQLSIVDAIVASFKDDIIDLIDEDKLLEQELTRYQEPVTYEDKQKLMETLRRKGFSYQVIQSHLS